MSSLQSEILARKKQSIIRLTALCRYELIKYLVYDIATSFNVLCVLLFSFCCFNLNFCSASICFLCLELDLYSFFLLITPQQKRKSPVKSLATIGGALHSLLGFLFAVSSMQEEIKDLCSISPLDNLHSLLH